MQVLVNGYTLTNILLFVDDKNLTSPSANPAKFIIESTMQSVELFQEYAKIFLFALVIAALISQLIKGG